MRSHCGCDSTRVLGNVLAAQISWIAGSILGAIRGGSAGPFGAMEGLAEAEALEIVISYGVTLFLIQPVNALQSVYVIHAQSHGVRLAPPQPVLTLWSWT